MTNTVNLQSAFVQLFIEKYKDKVWAIVSDLSNMKFHVIGHDRKLINSWIVYPANIPKVQEDDQTNTLNFSLDFGQFTEQTMTKPNNNALTQIIPDHLENILNFVKAEN